jgi:outer membrane protein OmpA-like peptidoglycan-associated protein
MRRLVLALSCLFVGLAGTAAAEPAGNLELDGFRPAIDARGYLSLNGSQVLDHGELSFGLGSLAWGHNMLHFANAPATYSVDNVVSATLVAAAGVHAFGIPLEVGAAMPFRIMNGARGPDMLGDPLNPNDDRRFRLDGQGVGDLGLHLKAQLLHRTHVGIGAIASVYLPTASPRDRFLGDRNVTPQFTAIADAQVGRFRFAVNAGIRLRSTVSFTDTGDAGSPATMGTITASAELPGGVAAAWALAPERVELVGEVFGAVPLGAHQGYQPLEALGGMKVYLAKSSYLSLGAGRGLVRDAGNPDLRAFIGIVFEPKPARRIAVTIPDEPVAFVGPPAARDDFPDRDNDGIRDDLDRCPDEPENYNGIADDDGCRDRDVIIDKHSIIVPLQSIEFEFDSAVLRSTSFGILDQVAETVNENPSMTLIEVQGHTDERGDDTYNLDLSERRAASVVRYLTEHGVTRSRLDPHGYGETQPLDKAHTEQAWTKNRRVEFIIREQTGG